MTSELHAITGATGALGSHIAEQLVAQGQSVRALVRPSSDRQFLTDLGVELIEGDLKDPRAAQRLVCGAKRVFHCAAKTDNWGPWSEYERGNIETTRNVVRACAERPEIERLVYMSTLSVYGHPSPNRDQLVDEEAELGQNLWLWDYYARSKIEAEKIVAELGARSTVIRPTSFYGPRDIAFLPRLMRTIRRGGMWLFGPADNLQNVLFVGDVAAMAISAGNSQHAAGQIYNCCSAGDLTQRELIDNLSEAMQVAQVRRRLPHRFAHRIAFAFELVGRAIRKKTTPSLTRHALSVFVRPVHFSSEKAVRDLGWRPTVSTQEGVRRTTEWLKTAAPELFEAFPKCHTPGRRVPMTRSDRRSSE